MSQSGDPEICDCGQLMIRNYHREQTNTRGDYNDPITSESLAFDAADVNEHRRRFPNIDLEIDGRVARPVLRSRGQKVKYLKDRGWCEQN
jgi:hypothetical protein